MLVGTCLAVLTTLLVSSFDSYRTRSLNEQARSTIERMEQRMQQLQAGIGFDSARRQLLLGIRDEILRINPSASLQEAFEYARLITEAADKYPTVEPLLLLAIGAVESGFRADAISPSDARGLYQISPATGRLLASALGWEYADEMLLNPEKNTEMAALYLDILFAAYNDVELVLAEYNGGPLNAGYFRAGAGRLASETRDYVPKVLDVYVGLKEGFERGIRTDRLQLIHLDSRRRGKSFGSPPLPVEEVSDPALIASTEP
jgi:soluble lytic murein transglycosylase-like protein